MSMPPARIKDYVQLECHIGQQRQEDKGAEIAIGPEAAQAIGLIVDVEGHDLPDKMQAGQRQAGEKYP
jgi:hypothetical protein